MVIVDTLAIGTRSLAASATRSLRRRRSRRPIYLIAPAGFPNYGDELILRVWLRTLAVLRRGTPVVVDCHTPGQAALLHRDEHPDVIFTDTVFRLVNEVDGAARAASGAAAAELALSAADNVRAAIDNVGHQPKLSAGVQLLHDAEIVHIVGGGFVNDNWPQHLGLLTAAAAVADRDDPRGRTRAVATGQGFLPVDDPEPLSEAVRGMDLVSVRDAESARVASAGGIASGAANPGGGATGRVDIRHVGDDAWLAHAGFADAGQMRAGLARAGLAARAMLRSSFDLYCAHPDIARDLVLCLQSDVVDADGVARAAEQLLREWAIPGRRMTVLECIPGADVEVWNRLRERAAESGLSDLGLDDARFVPFDELRRIGLPARPGQTWMTTRFHPHLLAAAAGASGVAIDGNPDYYGIKHGSLVAAGSSWQVLDVVGREPDGGGRALGRALGSALPTGGGFAPEIVRERGNAAFALAREIYG